MSHYLRFISKPDDSSVMSWLSRSTSVNSSQAWVFFFESFLSFENFNLNGSAFEDFSNIFFDSEWLKKRIFDTVSLLRFYVKLKAPVFLWEVADGGSQTHDVRKWTTLKHRLHTAIFVDEKWRFFIMKRIFFIYYNHFSSTKIAVCKRCLNAKYLRLRPLYHLDNVRELDKYWG